MACRSMASRLSVVALVFIYFAPLGAGQAFQPPSVDELRMTSEPQAPGAPAIILYRQVDRDDNGRTSHEDHYVRIKILTEEGRRYGDIEIPFYKGSDDIVNIRARTVRPDGSIADFDGKVFEKSIAKAKGFKYLAKTFTLPDVQVGSIIEYSYTDNLREYFLYDTHWILSNELFTRDARFSLKPYVSSYETWNIRWSWQSLPPGTEQPKQGPDRIVRLEAHNIPPFPTEDYMPPPEELKSRVDFTYSREAVDPDETKFWKHVGKQLNDQLEAFIDKRKAMEQAVGQIVSPSDAPEVKLQRIYARVQQLRNTSYEVQKTEQEQRRTKEKQANNVEDIWKRGYGNGVELTWLYLALVRAAGFEAYGVWASDRLHYFFNPKLEDPSKLNANVVLVKLNGKDVYCDPGAAFVPFGLLTWPETGVRGLRLDKDGGEWVRTTLPESSASQIVRTARLKVSDTGDLEGKLTVTFTGLEALRRRVEERNDDEADRKKSLEDEAKDYVPAACEAELVNTPEWNSSSSSLVAEFHLKIPGWVAGAGHRALFPVGLFSSTEKHLFDHANRTHPVYFEFPSQKIDDVTVELPSGWQIASLPIAQDQNARVITYTLNIENDKGVLHVKRKLVVDVLLLETKYYSALRNFFQVVRTGDEEQIVLQPGVAAADNN